MRKTIVHISKHRLSNTFEKRIGIMRVCKNTKARGGTCTEDGYLDYDEKRFHFMGVELALMLAFILMCF